jgi:hypothetical protein
VHASDGTDWTAVLDTLDASTSTEKGVLSLFKLTDPTHWITFSVTARIAHTNYRELTVTVTGSSSASPLVNGDALGFTFTRTGDSPAVAGSGISINSGTVSLGTIAPGDVLANTTTVAAAPSATSVSALLDAALDNTQGDVIYRSGSSWTVLQPGTAGQYLQTGGAGANPTWATVPGGVNKVVAGSGLAGGTITSTGTISLGSIPAGELMGNAGASAAVPSGVAIGANLSLSASGTLSALVQPQQWQAGTVTALGNLLSINSGTLSAADNWNAGTVTALGSGLTLSGGTLSGSVQNWSATSVSAVGSDLAVNSGTIDIAAIAASSLFGNPGAASAKPSAIAVGTNLSLSTTGTLSASVPTTLAGDGDVDITSPANGDRLHYSASISKWVNGREPYIVPASAPGAPTASQVVVAHTFPLAVTFPANFGTTNSGAVSGGGAIVNATSAFVFTAYKCPSGSDPTSNSNWSGIGTATYAAGGHTPSFATTAGAAQSFAAGDMIKIVAQDTTDISLTNPFFTLAGDR